LLLGKALQRELEVARHHLGHAVVIEANELAQKGYWQHGLLAVASAFLFDDDLGQDAVGQVIAGFGIEHDKIAITADHGRQIVERNVGAGFCVVETPICILFDDDGFAFFGLCFWLVQHENGPVYQYDENVM
jgi:hypothetical protein